MRTPVLSESAPVGALSGVLRRSLLAQGWSPHGRLQTEIQVANHQWTARMPRPFILASGMGTAERRR
jgi:hypothetical protein